MAKFVYLNVNPEQEKRSDCVSRAITLATGYKYSDVRKMLFFSSKLMKCMKLAYECYSHLLDDTLKFPRVNCRGLTIDEFADKYPFGTYIIRIEGHLTCVKNNSLYDIWDCRNEFCDIVWRVD